MVSPPIVGESLKGFSAWCQKVAQLVKIIGEGRLSAAIIYNGVDRLERTVVQAKKSFTHIVVNEEDDVVIQAGTQPAPSSEKDAPASDSRSEGSEAVAQSPARPDASDAGDGKAVSKRTERAKAAKDKEYRETTLDDLSGSPMSVTQKVIIGLCLVGVIAAVVYCVAFMG